MEHDSTKLYKVREFAKLAGVTVRALHHYDRLGLLKPTARTNARYRLYSDRDLARLEQIVVLKFIGLPLGEIRDLLHDHVHEDLAVADALGRQQRVLAAKRDRINHTIRAIAQAERSLRSTGHPDWPEFRHIIKEIEMQSNTEWSRKYYSPEAQAKVEERRALWSPELQEQVSRDWAQLFGDVEAALGEDPASARARALADRWCKLVEGFTGGDREIQKGLNAMYADQANWPAESRERFQIKPEIQEFIVKAMRARA